MVGVEYDGVGVAYESEGGSGGIHLAALGDSGALPGDLGVGDFRGSGGILGVVTKLLVGELVGVECPGQCTPEGKVAMACGPGSGGSGGVHLVGSGGRGGSTP